jgi:hypothetical protein
MLSSLVLWFIGSAVQQLSKILNKGMQCSQHFQTVESLKKQIINAHFFQILLLKIKHFNTLQQYQASSGSFYNKFY